MNVVEIFTQISSHMIEGIMIHSQLTDYFNFLSLEGYGKCHEYHFFAENQNYREFCQYYLDHYNKIIVSGANTNPNVIPEAWYKYTKQDVDTSTRVSSVQAGLEKWIKWENNTKIYYQKMYSEFVSLGEIATSLKIKEMIEDVDKELIEAQKMLLEDKAVEFDMTVIIPKQKEIIKRYNKKLEPYYK